ncbi:MAG: hypothetical protein UU80_C0006G0019 [candidate division WWE3 bacterium GW2011_GWA1_41_8]|uniref:Uncharacterized protein n=3 Tax=Katanobacteria TaxID=422282 RepID=A0A0G1AB21_UNCKA|nr:MAG: hypothetical protein UU72_C0003G0045 [candidate division WWE3 bacterium GW2011_GWB1_41_6]KKS22493.1 MAG: hypothetical protein UU80_C0006G0019 [candidate division WWE3 bacterium GW2011_GWA1_41_8]OGC56898.1 MAG: hypothetical protein A2976_00565 [candidate division WWE3 bacterium RIFCSPLOWO2_01_FULL_41_9]
MACEMCWHPGESHNDGCPLTNGSLEEFDKGYRTAFSGEVLTWNERRSYPLSFQLGYRVGKNAVEALVDVCVNILTSRG